jgi:hypothetical protein
MAPKIVSDLAKDELKQQVKGKRIEMGAVEHNGNASGPTLVYGLVGAHVWWRKHRPLACVGAFGSTAFSPCFVNI